MGFPDFGQPEVAAPGNAGVQQPPPPFDHQRWEKLRREQLGVAVIDPQGHKIGFAVGAGKYAPVDGLKHVLVGELDDYGWFNPPGSGDEADFNLFITPAPPFQFILDDVVKLMTADERGSLHTRKRGQGFCLEAEITPDEGFYHNEFFPTEDPIVSPLVGRKIGVYGPWVRDDGHGGRPEIHPCEVIWWEAPTNRPGVRLTRFLLLLQDDSNRFDRPGDFNGPLPRPWSAFPRQAHITIALQLRSQAHNQYDLRLLRSREIADMPNPGAASTMRSFGGQPAVTIHKRTATPNKVQVALSAVEADPDGRYLRCFLGIGLQVGTGDRGDEGYALLRLETLSNEEPGG
ncbi:hypothetical protein [Nonomuraea sp. NPDC049141]|uniref:hypothetical protein n=1 Tax=Nonomuraea sp. NPDC049141 TaxID=3155500 RepID=UPI0033F72302